MEIEFKNGSHIKTKESKEDCKRSSFADWYLKKHMERIEYWDKLIIDLELTSGYNIEDLIDKFKKGYTLEPPKTPLTLSELIIEALV
jgi:hypothetical protein